MKLSLMPAIVLALVAVACAHGPRAHARQRPLLLTAEVIGRRSCAGDRLDTLQVRLRLRYRNVGSQKLILYVGKNLFYQTKIRRAAADPTAARPYEVTVLNARYNDAQAEVIDRASPGKAFAVLSPGGVYETEIVVGAAVDRAGAERVNNTLVAGEHTLYVVASTWYESRKLAEELRRRWQRRGLLWVEPVASEPLKLQVEQGRPAESCR